MNTLIPNLHSMSRVDMLRAMEELWAELCKDDSWESPSWHDEVLKETDERYRAGIEVPVDWDLARQQLLSRTGKA